ncbi:hypothetical protein P43SY_005933 [Pythium insidiosum]|uniref:FYVE-type domain-containing protein n=1 Tax=Pythium insidiosum TaxID=114742 RepID=A0AAD5LLE3_PYTIN|nr:hypothetical protein P43SY_005933 [Pythium insidiosum]
MPQNDAAELPFPDPLPPLSRRDAHALLEDAHASFEELFTVMQVAQSTTYGTRVGGASGSTMNDAVMCSKMTVFGTLEEVAALFTGTESHFVIDLAQSRRLYELESPTAEHPMRCTAVRWSHWKATSKLVCDRDMLYLESMKSFVDPRTGRRGWARCTKSVELAVCPPSTRSNGPVRAELFTCGSIFRETARFGVLEMVSLLHIDVKNVPSWVGRAALMARKKNALSLNHVLKVRRRFRGLPGHAAQFRDDYQEGDKRACKGCHERVSRWKKSYRCRSCDALICKQCAAMSYFDADTATLKNRMCADCSFDTAAPRGKSDDALERGSSEATVATPSHDEKDGRARTYSHFSVETDSADFPRADEASDVLQRLDISSKAGAGGGRAQPTITRHHSHGKLVQSATASTSARAKDRAASHNFDRSTENAALMDLSYLQDFAKTR